MKFFPSVGNIIGCDFAGIVEELGADAPRDLQVGDRVASWVHGCMRLSTIKPHTSDVSFNKAAYPDKSAFAEYVIGTSTLAIRLPGSWTFEEAAQLGIAGFTSCMCLYYAQSLPTPLAPATSPIDILVWAGSSSVGQYVVQLASQAGLRVISTCSPRNFELVQSLGAREVLDYNDENTTAKIRELTGNKLAHAVDCISEGSTGERIAEAMGDAGGDVSIILKYEQKRKDVRNKHVLGYQIFGKVCFCLGEEEQRADSCVQAITQPIKLPADPEQYKFGVQSAKLLTDLLDSGKVRPSPIKLMPNGLASVKEGFEYMENGKVLQLSLYF